MTIELIRKPATVSGRGGEFPIGTSVMPGDRYFGNGSMFFGTPTAKGRVILTGGSLDTFRFGFNDNNADIALRQQWMDIEVSSSASSQIFRGRPANDTGTPTVLGRVNHDSAWTLGTSGFSGHHILNGMTRLGSHAYTYSNAFTNLSNGANADFTIGSGLGAGTVGFLVVYSVRSGNGNFTTMTTYSLLANGLTTATITQIATATGLSGASSFTATVNSQNPTVLRINNTSGVTANIEVGFFGVVGG